MSSNQVTTLIKKVDKYLQHKLDMNKKRKSSRKVTGSTNLRPRLDLSCFELSRCSHNLLEYIDYLNDASDTTPTSLIYALMILEEVESKIPRLLSETNTHLLYLTCFYLAIKFLDDVIYPTCQYAKIGGVSLRTLIEMENKVLELLDYKICLKEEDYSHLTKML